MPVEDVGLLPRYLTLARLGPEQPHTYVLETQAEQPPGMVRVSPRGPQLLAIAGLEHVKPFELGDFWIDRLEVTNRAYKAFVDAGGYSERRFWTNPFIKAGKTITWEEAMSGFHDSTGRPGPSTWELGTYPEGQGRVSSRRRELVRSRCLLGVRRQVPADDLSLERRRRSARDEQRSLAPWSILQHGGRSPSAGQARSAATGRTILPATRKSGVRTRQVETGVTRSAAAGAIRLYFFNDADGRSPWDRSPALGFRSMKVVDAGNVRVGAPRAGAFLLSRFQPGASGLRRRVSGLFRALQLRPHGSRGGGTFDE